MAGDEPVTSPDQHKPGTPRASRVGAVVVTVLLLGMLVGNHEGNIENVWLIGLAGALVLALVGDWVLRRNGLRS